MHNIQFSGVLRKARKAREEGNFSLAISLYKHAIRMYPEISWVYEQNIDRINKFDNPSNVEVILNICSIPDRILSFEKTINSLVNQVDRINIYLDGYKDVPNFLSPISKKCDIRFSEGGRSLRDNGKFMNLCQHENCYYFSVDDDIVYPPDYVAFMISKIEEYGREAVVGVHGVILPEEPDRYFSKKRKVFHFENELKKDIPVNFLGTGTTAFHSQLLQEMKVEFFEKTGMTDLFLSIFCKKNRIPMIAVERPIYWLKENKNLGPTLYTEYINSDIEQTLLVSNNSPWGKHSILSILERFHAKPYYSSLFLEVDKLDLR